MDNSLDSEKVHADLNKELNPDTKPPEKETLDVLDSQEEKSQSGDEAFYNVAVKKFNEGQFEEGLKALSRINDEFTRDHHLVELAEFLVGQKDFERARTVAGNIFQSQRKDEWIKQIDKEEEENNERHLAKALNLISENYTKNKDKKRTNEEIIDREAIDNAADEISQITDMDTRDEALLSMAHQFAGMNIYGKARKWAEHISDKDRHTTWIDHVNKMEAEYIKNKASQGEAETAPSAPMAEPLTSPENTNEPAPKAEETSLPEKAPTPTPAPEISPEPPQEELNENRENVTDKDINNVTDEDINAIANGDVDKAIIFIQKNFNDSYGYNLAIMSLVEEWIEVGLIQEAKKIAEAITDVVWKEEVNKKIADREKKNKEKPEPHVSHEPVSEPLPEPEEAPQAPFVYDKDAEETGRMPKAESLFKQGEKVIWDGKEEKIKENDGEWVTFESGVMVDLEELRKPQEPDATPSYELPPDLPTSRMSPPRPQPVLDTEKTPVSPMLPETVEEFDVKKYEEAYQYVEKLREEVGRGDKLLKLSMALKRCVEAGKRILNIKGGIDSNFENEKLSAEERDSLYEILGFEKEPNFREWAEDENPGSESELPLSEPEQEPEQEPEPQPEPHVEAPEEEEDQSQEKYKVPQQALDLISEMEKNSVFNKDLLSWLKGVLLSVESEEEAVSLIESKIRNGIPSEDADEIIEAIRRETLSRPKQEEGKGEVVGYCRACGKKLYENTVVRAEGTVFCAEHATIPIRNYNSPPIPNPEPIPSIPVQPVTERPEEELSPGDLAIKKAREEAASRVMEIDTELSSDRSEYLNALVMWKGANRKKKFAITKLFNDLGVERSVPESEMPPELLSLKKKYEKTRRNKNLMFLEEGEIWETKNKKGEKIREYGFNPTLLAEMEKEAEIFHRLLAERMPSDEAGRFKKAMQTWSKVPLAGRVLTSSALSTGLMVAGGMLLGYVTNDPTIGNVASGVALAGNWVYKAGRAYVGAKAAQYVGKKFDGVERVEKRKKKSEERKLDELMDLGENVHEFNLDRKTKKLDKFLEKEQKRLKRYGLKKAGVMLMVGGATNIGVNFGVGKVLDATHIGTSSGHHADSAKPEVKPIPHPKIETSGPPPNQAIPRSAAPESLDMSKRSPFARPGETPPTAPETPLATPAEKVPDYMEKGPVGPIHPGPLPEHPSPTIENPPAHVAPSEPPPVPKTTPEATPTPVNSSEENSLATETRYGDESGVGYESKPEIGGTSVDHPKVSGLSAEQNPETETVLENGEVIKHPYTPSKPIITQPEISGDEAGTPYKPNVEASPSVDESGTPMESVAEKPHAPSSPEIEEAQKHLEESRARLNQTRLEREALEEKLRNIQNNKVPPPPLTARMEDFTAHGKVPSEVAFESHGTAYRIADIEGKGKVLQMEINFTGQKTIAEIAHTTSFNGRNILTLDSQFQDGKEYLVVREAFVKAQDALTEGKPLFSAKGTTALPIPFEGGRINVVIGTEANPNAVHVLLNGKEIAKGVVTNKGAELSLDPALKSRGFFAVHNAYERSFDKIQPLLKSLRLPKTVDFHKAA